MPAYVWENLNLNCNPNHFITFALKSLTSNERKSMLVISDRINSLEEKSKMIIC